MKALVIGATGLLGYGVTKQLYRDGWEVRAIGRENVAKTEIFPNEIEYISGNFYDEKFLINSLRGIDKVFFFLSSTFPSTSSNSLEFEIAKTAKGLDYLIRKMIYLDIEEIVYPSSGGTIYGNANNEYLKETDVLNPITPYGVGKKFCEDILKFYSKFGISSTVLRVGNVYGSYFSRNVNQGVIDIFIQKSMAGESATIWGDALTDIRDYIYIDDFSEAVASIGKYRANGIEFYNVGSGIGTKLDSIISIINKYASNPLKFDYVENNSASSIKRIVLDINKIKNKTGWKPRFDIDKGIAETIKKRYLNR